VAEHRAVVPAGPCLEVEVHPEAARGTPAGTGRAAVRIRAVAESTAWEAVVAAVGRCEGRSLPHERDTDSLARQEPGDPARSLESASRRPDHAMTGIAVDARPARSRAERATFDPHHCSIVRTWPDTSTEQAPPALVSCNGYDLDGGCSAAVAHMLWEPTSGQEGSGSAA
jgi:hypothetical protein